MVKIENNLFIVVFLELIFEFLKFWINIEKICIPQKKIEFPYLNRIILILYFYKTYYNLLVIISNKNYSARDANLCPMVQPMATPIPPSLTAQCSLFSTLFMMGFFCWPTPKIPLHTCSILILDSGKI